MKYAAMFGAIVFLAGIVIRQNSYDLQAQNFAIMVSFIGFCLAVSFALAWWLP